MAVVAGGIEPTIQPIVLFLSLSRATSLPLFLSVSDITTQVEVGQLKLERV